MIYILKQNLKNSGLLRLEIIVENLNRFVIASLLVFAILGTVVIKTENILGNIMLLTLFFYSQSCVNYVCKVWEFLVCVGINLSSNPDGLLNFPGVMMSCQV